MQVLAAARTGKAAGSTVMLVGGALVAMILVGGGVLVAYLAFGTGVVERFTPSGRATAAEMAFGAAAWGVALAAPAVFVIVGLARLVATIEAAGARAAGRGPVARVAGALTDDYAVAANVRTPDGRNIPELVVGPFGVAVVEPVPPRGAIRRQGDAWAFHAADGRWHPIENPLDRAARDAERVRRWLGSEDRDFVVKVYAAVVDSWAGLNRTPSAAVIAPDQVAAWIASLPAQRSLSTDRRLRVVEMLGDLR